MRKFIFSILKIFRKLVSRKEETFRKIPLVIKTFNFLYQFAGPKGIVLTEVQGHKMFMDAKSSGLVLTGYWEKHETEIFKKLIKKGMTVVDIGAHIGYYTLIAANLVGKKGKVYAFEPEQKNYSLLKKNIKINEYRNIVPVKKAVSSKTGTAKLFLQTSALHTLICPQNNKQSIEIETVTLDNFIGENKINFIKIDAEGAEYMIFQGMRKILENNEDLIILTEFYPALLKRYVEPKRYLEELIKSNFKLFIISDRKTKPIDAGRLMDKIDKKPNDYSLNLLCLKERFLDNLIK